MVGQATAALLPTCGSVRQIAVPPAARRISTLGHIDYEDAFVFDTDAARDRTPEQWARLTLEDAPLAIRTALRSGWSALGLQGRPTRSGEAVLGWEVRYSTADFALLGAASSSGWRRSCSSRCDRARFCSARSSRPTAGAAGLPHLTLYLPADRGTPPASREPS
jgi:hypothetical protein